MTRSGSVATTGAKTGCTLASAPPVTRARQLEFAEARAHGNRTVVLQLPQPMAAGAGLLMLSDVADLDIGDPGLEPRQQRLGLSQG